MLRVRLWRVSCRCFCCITKVGVELYVEQGDTLGRALVKESPFFVHEERFDDADVTAQKGVPARVDTWWTVASVAGARTVMALFVYVTCVVVQIACQGSMPFVLRAFVTWLGVYYGSDADAAAASAPLLYGVGLATALGTLPMLEMVFAGLYGRF
jgi:hypothetical protein